MNGFMRDFKTDAIIPPVAIANVGTTTMGQKLETNLDPTLGRVLRMMWVGQERKREKEREREKESEKERDRERKRGAENFNE